MSRHQLNRVMAAITSKCSPPQIRINDSHPHCRNMSAISQCNAKKKSPRNNTGNLNSEVLYRNMPVSTWDTIEPPQLNIHINGKIQFQDESLKPLWSNCVSFCISVSHTTAGGGELWSLCRSQGVCSCECKIRILTEPHTHTHARKTILDKMWTCN